METHIDSKVNENQKSDLNASQNRVSEFVDAFRALYGKAKAHFTWWSMRTNGRPENKGLRIDSFIVTPDLLPPTSDICRGNSDEQKQVVSKVDGRKTLVVYDTYRLENETQGVSDHCPVGLILKSL